jgi:copper(I)-binding protein
MLLISRSFIEENKVMLRSLILTLLIAAMSLTACGVGPSQAQIKVEDAWARPAPLAGGNGAVYLRLVNTGGEADQLLGGSSPLAQAVEVHKTTMSQDVMKMEPIPSLAVPAGGQVELKPGGFHIMLIGLKQPLAAGSRLPLTLRFEKSGDLQLEIQVREPGD